MTFYKSAVNSNMIEFKRSLITNKNLVIGVSMGVDSLAVSHFLSRNHNVNLIHVNHGTPLANYFQDKFLTYVSYLKSVSRHQVTYEVFKGETILETSEAYLRDLRYGFFDKFMSVQTLFTQLIVCHHLDDCVESYLMNCFNGKPEHDPIPEVTNRYLDNDKSYQVIRPFLKTEKSEFIDYCERNGLTEYLAEDESNFDTKYRRNWLRNVLIPEIETRYKGLKTVVKKRL